MIIKRSHYFYYRFKLTSNHFINHFSANVINPRTKSCFSLSLVRSELNPFINKKLVEKGIGGLNFLVPRMIEWLAHVILLNLSSIKHLNQTWTKNGMRGLHFPIPRIIEWLDYVLLLDYSSSANNFIKITWTKKEERFTLPCSSNNQLVGLYFLARLFTVRLKIIQPIKLFSRRCVIGLQTLFTNEKCFVSNMWE